MFELFIVSIIFICILLIFKKNYIGKLESFIPKLKEHINLKSDQNLSHKDRINILNFLEKKFNNRILLKNNISYILRNNKYEFNNVKIIELNNFNNIEKKIEHIISFDFIPSDNEIFISNHNLFGLSGEYIIKSINTNKEQQIESFQNIKTFNNQVEDIFNDDIKLTTDVENTWTDDIMNIIPDNLQLSTEIEIDSIRETTELD